MPSEQNLTQLVINKVDTEDTLEAMDQAGLVNENEFYLVEELGGFDLTIDSTPTEGSANLVTSGGVYQALSEIDVSSQIEGLAPLASPAFTGTPTAPTAAEGTNTTQIATTAFVKTAVSGISVPVQSVNGKTGTIQLSASDVGATAANNNLVQLDGDILKTLAGTEIDAGAKIATGSYTGTGGYNSSSQTSLTFGFVPKLVFITGTTLGSSDGILGIFVRPDIRTNSKRYAGIEIYTDNYTVKLSDFYVKCEGTTMSWYWSSGQAAGHAMYQLDASGQTYHYIAFG